jgi:hypothetical protein
VRILRNSETPGVQVGNFKRLNKDVTTFKLPTHIPKFRVLLIDKPRLRRES